MELTDIYAPIQQDLETIEQGLGVIADVDEPILSQLLNYVIKSGGKRIRSALTLLTGKFYDYNLDLLVPMAEATELLHLATLVHDDIVDASAVRHGKPTVSCAWDEGKALLLGDYLFAKAGSLVASTGNLRAITLFAHTLMIISGGELRQAGVELDVKGAYEHYYNWIRAKTASLFVMATESGAVLSQAPENIVEAMREYGNNLGIAFQIVDDVLDFVGKEKQLGKPVGADLSQGVMTLPLILFIESYPDDNLVKRAIEKKDPESVALAVEKIRNSSVIAECLNIASDFCTQACSVLEKLPDNASHKALTDLATYIIQRSK